MAYQNVSAIFEGGRLANNRTSLWAIVPRTILWSREVEAERENKSSCARNRNCRGSRGEAGQRGDEQWRCPRYRPSQIETMQPVLSARGSSVGQKAGLRSCCVRLCAQRRSLFLAERRGKDRNKKAGCVIVARTLILIWPSPGAIRVSNRTSPVKREEQPRRRGRFSTSGSSRLWLRRLVKRNVLIDSFLENLRQICRCSPLFSSSATLYRHCSRSGSIVDSALA